MEDAAEMGGTKSQCRKVACGALVGMVLLAVAGCGDAASDSGQIDPSAGDAAGTPADGSPLIVYAVNYPLTYFTERIGGDHVEVTLPRELSQGDPAYAEPDTDTIVALQGADLIVRNGAGYDPWFDRVTLPASKIVDTSAGLSDRLITIEGAVTHSHGPEGEHSHDQTAFTTWLDPLLAIEQAEAIAAALAARRPAVAATFASNFAALRADLEEVDGLFARGATTLGDAPLLASYPVYQYFARRYGLGVRALQLESWVMPTDSQWDELAGLYADQPARRMLWESPPIADITNRLQSIGIDVIVIDPCSTPPESGDFLSVMRDNAARLATTR